MERIRDPKLSYFKRDKNEMDRYWVSYRGQTLARTGQIYKHIFENINVNIHSEGHFLFYFSCWVSSEGNDVLQGGPRTSMLSGLC